VSTSWDAAPCGLLTLRADGTITDANSTFLDWVGRTRTEVVDQVRLSALLSVGGRIYWETHLAPLLHVERRVDEVAVELASSQGRLPVLLTAVVAEDGLVQVALSSALQRSHYERELVAARASAERSAAQVHALQDVTAALSRALGVGAVGTALLDALVGPLGAAAGTLWLVDTDGATRMAGSRGEPAAGLPTAGALLHEPAATQVDGRVVVPLHGTAALQGVLSVVPRGDAGADPLDLEVLTAVGQQAGLALDRAQLYEQSAGVARELQHSLLAGDPPDDPRYQVATVYRPGVEMLEVGGDWYDVFLAEPGVLSFVVGDVVGRGLRAASAMGQLRSAVRAVAGPGIGPARLLSRLDHFVEQVEAAGMATLAYAELDLGTGVVRYSCAGHPPPLLLPTDAELTLLWDGRSTPLGAFLHPVTRPEAEVQLAAGDRLLLYTDGLIERRDRGLDDGLELLTAAAAAARTKPLDVSVSTLTQVLLEDEQSRDDVCVLLLSWAGPDFDRALSADLGELSATRRALHSWLGVQGADRETREEVVLAASEAVANAAEHGSGNHPDEQVTVAARVEAQADGTDDVVVTVRDEGRWRKHAPSLERGRGLLIIRALMDDVLVDTSSGTRVVLRRRLQREAS
jgi:serine phosphatase RsbU (regulator of sigma subunit)/anti-sigma regulatory factor (Ser/Thr protein kinase)